MNPTTSRPGTSIRFTFFHFNLTSLGQAKWYYSNFEFTRKTYNMETKSVNSLICDYSGHKMCIFHSLAFKTKNVLK